MLKTIGAVDTFRINQYQQLFGGYIFYTGEPHRDLMIILSKSKETLREVINGNSESIWIDFSGTEARICVREDWVQPDGKQMHFGFRDIDFTRMDVWSDDKEGIENLINKYFYINPIGEFVTIEPPMGFDDSENIVCVD